MTIHEALMPNPDNPNIVADGITEFEALLAYRSERRQESLSVAIADILINHDEYLEADHLDASSS